MGKSLLARAAKRVGAAKLLEALSAEERERLTFEWTICARPEQLPPDGDWLLWLVLAGRGFGKSRTGAEFSRQQAKDLPGSHGALVGPTAADVRDVMVKAILAASPPWEGLAYEPSKRLLSWANGTTATLYSAEEPDRLRGPQHHWAWIDEVCAWQYPDEVWDMLMMTMRLGQRPRVVASTTPRPIPLLKRLIWCHELERHQNAIGEICKRCGRPYGERVQHPDTAISRGSTYDNRANLSPAFITTVVDRYEGTRLGRQELHAEILDDIQGALWTRDMIELRRVRDAPAQFRRVAVAVDPSGSAKKEADEAGIVVAGIADCRCQGKTELHGFVLNDKSGKFSPADMGQTAIKAYRDFKADRVVAEDNFGGQIIADLLHLIDPRVPYKAVHASRGKIVRAEPVAALYERGRVHHVGMHAKLEDELCTYTPQEPKSPGRMDALVWALTDLMLDAPWMGTEASHPSPMSDEYYAEAEAREQRATHLQGFR